MRHLRSRCIVILALVLSWHVALAQGDVERSAFGPLVEDLLSHLHAVVVPCDLVLDRATICFTLAPATAASVAEGVERLLDEYGAALVRSAWHSGNGVHRVELQLDDDLWGVLELWLSEPADRTVAGLLKYVTRRRSGGP